MGHSDNRRADSVLSTGIVKDQTSLLAAGPILFLLFLHARWPSSRIIAVEANRWRFLCVDEDDNDNIKDQQRAPPKGPRRTRCIRLLLSERGTHKKKREKRSNAFCQTGNPPTFLTWRGVQIYTFFSPRALQIKRKSLKCSRTALVSTDPSGSI